MKSCVWNDRKEERCKCKDEVWLKWRLAADMGRGNIVMMECVNMVLDEGVVKYEN
jgi:hypothetical protein